MEEVKRRIIKHRHLSLFIIGAIFFTIYHSNPEAKPTEISIEETSVTTEFYEPMEPFLQRFDSLIGYKIDTSHLVGGALVVVQDGNISLLRCYGVKRVGSTDSVDSHTVFRLASVSKGFAGILAGILDNEQVLSLDDKVIKYLPEFRLKDSINTYTLTIRHLLSHTTGLVPHAFDNLVEHNIPLNEIMSQLNQVDIAGPPGMYYGYQNVMFSLFDTISVLSTSKSYAELVEEKIFQPFGMSNASIGYNSFYENGNKAYPHRGSPASYFEKPINTRYYNTLPAAGVNASIMDMANYMLTITSNDSVLLNSRIKDEVFQPQIRSYVRYKYFRNWKDVHEAYYGLGWRIVNSHGKKILYHGGFVEGYRADIAICLEDRTGIAFLTNSPSEVSSESIPDFWDLYFTNAENQSRMAVK